MAKPNEANDVEAPDSEQTRRSSHCSQVIPDGYVLQDGCWNCVHCFIKTEHDQGASLYCGYGAPARPQCQSVAMGECDAADSFESRYERWERWSKNREVYPFAKCNKHEAMTEAAKPELLHVWSVWNEEIEDRLNLPEMY